MVRRIVVIVSVVFLIMSGVFFALPTRAQEPYDVQVFRDENNLVVYIPANQSVSVRGFDLNVNGVSHLLESYPSFAGLPLDSIPTPICFRLQRQGSEPLTPQSCAGGVPLLTQELADADVFWRDATTDYLVLLMQGTQTVGLCPGEQTQCNMQFTPRESSILPPPPTSLPAGCAFTLGTGVNYPWNHYGHDFGLAWRPHDGVSSSAQDIDADFAYLKSQGVQVVRWFLFADGRAAPEFNDNGMVTGYDEYFYPDVDAALTIAQKYDIYLIFVLFDFHLADAAQDVSDVQTGGRTALITDSAVQQSFVDNALQPLLERYGHYRNILAWEVINEPEWIMEGVPGGGSVGTPISVEEMQAFVNRVVEYIEQYTYQYATVGSASRGWMMDYWTESNLDFYQYHYYDVMEGQNPLEYSAADLGLEQSVILGEFPTASTTHALTDFLDSTCLNGYNGALAWSYNAEDEFTDFQTGADQFAAWAEQNASERLDLHSSPPPVIWDFEDGTDQGWGVYDNSRITPLMPEQGGVEAGISHGDGEYVLSSSVFQTNPLYPNARRITLAVPYDDDLSNARLTAWVYLPEEATPSYADTKLFLFNDRWCWFESPTPRFDYEDCDPTKPFAGNMGTWLQPGEWVRVTWDLSSLEWTNAWQNVLGVQIWIEDSEPYNGVIYIDDITIER